MEKILKAIIQETNRLNNEGRTSEAIYLLEQIASNALNGLALSVHQHNSNDKAIKYLDMALKVDCGSWIPHSNKCHIYNVTGHYQEARESSLKALEYCNQKTHSPYYNAAVVLQNLGKTEEAITMYRKAIEINPKIPIVHYNLACSLLAAGHMKEGWKEYESRFEAFDKPKKMYERWKNKPTWDGSNFKGKTLCIFSEQGLGDYIQFARYFPMVKARGGKVITEVQEELAPLINKKLKVDKTIPRARAIEDWPKPCQCDLVVSVCSLPGILGDVSNKPYIFAPKRLSIQSNHYKNKKIGICYAGTATHQNDYMRSIPLRLFRPISELPHIQLFSLQKEIGIRKWPIFGNVNLLQGSEGMNCLDLAPSIKNLADCAAYISQMDLIITVDTAIAHLAGAMGKPVWILIPKIMDWRWLENRTDSPWYPTALLFRQQEYFKWDEIFDNILKALSSQNLPS